MCELDLEFNNVWQAISLVYQNSVNKGCCCYCAKFKITSSSAVYVANTSCTVELLSAS